jgi:hypothetical protein
MIFGILGLVATFVVGFTIWLIQEFRNKKALAQQREDFKKDMLEILPKVLPVIMAEEHEKRTRQPVTPETRAEFVAVARTSATVLGEYFSSKDFKLVGTGPSIWDSPDSKLWTRLAPQAKPVDQS